MKGGDAYESDVCIIKKEKIDPTEEDTHPGGSGVAREYKGKYYQGINEMNLTLRPYQSTIIHDIRAAFRAGYRAPLLQSPTASGKTVMFAFITESAAKLGNRVIILVHRQELLIQTSRALFSLNVPHGLISPGHSISHDLVQVASVQTLVRRLDKYPEPTFIIIDECHHVAAHGWRKILDAYPSAKLLGVTATPVRLDGKGLGIHCGGYFDTLVNGPTVMDLIDAGYLSRPVVYAPKTDVDLTGLHRKFGDYVTSEINERMDKPTITGSAVEHYKRLCPGEPAIAFCASVKHAEHTAEQFNQAGIPAASIDGTLSDMDRRARISDLASGKICVLTSCDIVSEGTDIPVVSAAILLRPTASMGLYLQQVGRAMRIFPGKTRTVILDHVGNVFRHGFPDDEREWSLDGEKHGKGAKREQDEELNLVQCDRCYLVFRRDEGRCPACGWVVPVLSREITQVEGELEALERDEQRRIQMHFRRQEEGMARSLDDWLAIAEKRGYKRAWAYMRYHLRQNKKRQDARQEAMVI